MPNDLTHSFAEVAQLIQQSRQRALSAVNTELIDLYWQVGAYISGKIQTAVWGDGALDGLAAYLASMYPDLRGFSRPNLFRMRQFYEAYPDAEAIVSTALRQLPWSHNRVIVGRCKSLAERKFYLELAARERWTFRELERQLNGMLFARTLTSPVQASAAVAAIQPGAASIFKDSYLLDFLNLPQAHSEKDLVHTLLANLRSFLLELGRDFCFIGQEYRVQVGNRDFFIDLLFFHRGMSCLVAFELKVGEFEPADLGQLSFYLEALDRENRKPHEKPSIGVLLCAGKDRDVVEYALSRTLSPALVADYTNALPDKALLEAKLTEFHQLELQRQERRAEAH